MRGDFNLSVCYIRIYYFIFIVFLILSSSSLVIVNGILAKVVRKEDLK